MKRRWLFLDQHSAKHPKFVGLLQDPNVSVVVSDVYLTEFTRAPSSVAKRHLDELAKYPDRVWVAKSGGECVRWEIASLRRITQGRIIDHRTTQFMREQLSDTGALAARLTDAAVEQQVRLERYSDPFMGQQFIQLTKDVQGKMKALKDYKRRSGGPLSEEDLKSVIRNGRMALANYLIGSHKHEPQEAKTFALKDSYMLRSFCANLCRVIDWAHVKGIEGQGDEPMYNEYMDIEYVAAGSYFDAFLTNDERNVRNDLNLRQLVMLLSRTQKFRREKQSPE